MKREARDIILRPVISEKSYDGMDVGKYTFRVLDMATKPEIARAIEEIFKVHVTKVNTMRVKPKPKRRGMARGKTAQWKKAIVTLKEGDKIEILEGR
jgi:large subunit ribosomal protein L23